MSTVVYEAACVLSASPGQYSETRWVVAQVHSECCMCRGNEGKVLYKTERKKKKKKNTPAGPVIRKPQVLGIGVGVRTPTDILGVENKTI